MLLFSIMFLDLFNVVTGQFGPTGIIPECIDEVSLVPAGTLAVPYGSFLVCEYAIPFIVIGILIELCLNIDGIHKGRLINN